MPVALHSLVRVGQRRAGGHRLRLQACICAFRTGRTAAAGRRHLSRLFLYMQVNSAELQKRAASGAFAKQGRRRCSSPTLATCAGCARCPEAGAQLGALRRACAQNARGPGRPLSALACKGSVYALALNAPGSLVVAGTAESLVRVFEARTRGKVMKLRGHAGNVRRGARVAQRVLLSAYDRGEAVSPHLVTPGGHGSSARRPLAVASRACLPQLAPQWNRVLTKAAACVSARDALPSQ